MLSVRNKLMRNKPLDSTLHLRPDQFVGSVRLRPPERLAVPRIFRPVSNRTPSLLLARVLVNIVRRNKIRRRRFSRLDLVPLEQLSA